MMKRFEKCTTGSNTNKRKREKLQKTKGQGSNWSLKEDITPAIAKAKFEPELNDCKVCSTLSEKKRLKYSVAWSPQCPPGKERAKEKLVRLLQERYGISKNDIAHHIRVCVALQEESRFSKVDFQFNQLWEALELAHNVYMDDPSMFHANAYTALVRELRGCLMDLTKVQSADDMADEVVRVGLNPLVKRFIHTIVSEASSLREDLNALIPESEAERVTTAFVERLAMQFEDAVPYARDRIADVLNVKDKSKKKSVRHSTSKSGVTSTEPHGNVIPMPNRKAANMESVLP